MSYCSIFADRCTCPYTNDKYGNMQDFHDAADEIEESINDALKINPNEQREL